MEAHIRYEFVTYAKEPLVNVLVPALNDTVAVAIVEPSLAPIVT